MSSSSAEQKVKKLARLPSNTCCANCGTTKKFGFSTVCIKYFTFVCNNCKSSHQAISHRCKSLTMSSWTDQEVFELQRKGNDYARRTWLKNAPPIGQGGRPREGDHVDVFKRFVVDVYERKRYYGEDQGGNAAPAALSRPTHVATAVPMAPKTTTTTTTTTIRAPVRSAAPPPAPPQAAPPVVADLLDFASMTSTTTNQPSGQQQGANTTTNVAFEANFDAFAPQAAPVPALGSASTATTVPTAPIQNDPFQPTQSAAVSTGSSFNFMNMNNNSSSSSSSSNFTVAPLPAPAAATVPAIRKPVMNSHNTCQKSSMISSMAMSGPNNNQRGNNGMMGNGMGMGMGWNNNNNNNAMNQNSFGRMGNMQPMQQQQQQQQQKQMMMMQQQMNMMNGMGMGMGMGMGNNNAMGAGMMNHNNNNMMMMMNQQRNSMMNGNNNFGAMGNNGNRNSNGAMDSLQMNSSSMNAWSSGMKK